MDQPPVPSACQSRMREERGGRRRGKRTSLGSQLLDPTVSHRLHMQTQKRRKTQKGGLKAKAPQKKLTPLLAAALGCSLLRCAPLLGFGGKLAGGELHLSDRGKVDLPRRSRDEAERSSPLLSREQQEQAAGAAVAWKAQGMKLSSLGISVMVARAMSSSARLGPRGTERQRKQRRERERGVASNFPKNISEIYILASLLL